MIRRLLFVSPFTAKLIGFLWEHLVFFSSTLVSRVPWRGRQLFQQSPKSRLKSRGRDKIDTWLKEKRKLFGFARSAWHRTSRFAARKNKLHLTSAKAQAKDQGDLKTSTFHERLFLNVVQGPKLLYRSRSEILNQRWCHRVRSQLFEGNRSYRVCACEKRNCYERKKK